ncbi:TATA-box-binding protein C [Halorubrum sp. JWXQ-INN 858]|uniref:TATA-box-binding protein n=1 Tax=Halorubrum sp. JWXQ-INN 858 TaxID=2690782 RepID=UPI0013579FA4|nr:TATA-box-binding protein C [Halorubrum sp. JWXQ-INN 858]MWV65661.1 TATA-box-binding protein C [Halorubrum sp. JWXQ-INN 858]
MTEIVNVVAAGKLGRELDVQTVAEDINAGVVKLSDETYSNRVVYLRREEGGPMVTLFRSGSYHVTGAKSAEEAEELKDWMVAMLRELGIEATATFAIKNVVMTADLGERVNLNALVIGLGLEKTEYEPEQFPGVVYRPPDIESVFLIFGSGKVVITGSPDVKTANEGFEAVTGRLKQIVG